MYAQIYYMNATNGKLYPAWQSTPIVLRWRQRYYEPGDFYMRFLYDDFFKPGALTYANLSHIRVSLDLSNGNSWEPSETGIIERIEKIQTASERYIDVSGRFAEAMFDWVVMTGNTVRSGNLSVSCRVLADTWFVTPGEYPIVTRPAASNIGGDAKFNVQDQSFSEVIWPELKKQEMTQFLDFMTEYDSTAKVYRGFFAYKNRIGDDYSSAQSVNEVITFGQPGKFAMETNGVVDNSGLKDYAYVRYGSGLSTTVDLRSNPNGRKRALVITSAVTKGATQSDADYLLAAKADATNQLGEYAAIAEYDVIPDRDFVQNVLMLDKFCGCGWAVDVEGVRTRITEVENTWRDGMLETKLGLGELRYKLGRR